MMESIDLEISVYGYLHLTLWLEQKYLNKKKNF